ncbi:MAG: hypothetical protein ACKN9M_08600 [Burkholderiaceae bacterium]
MNPIIIRNENTEQLASRTLDAINSLKDSKVPLRVVYKSVGDKVVVDVHLRKWGEWFNELFIKVEKRVELNRRVATVLQEALASEQQFQPVMKDIRAAADAGLELSPAQIFQMMEAKPLDRPIKQNFSGKPIISVREADPLQVPVETCLLSVGSIYSEGDLKNSAWPQFHAHARPVIAALELADENMPNARLEGIDRGLPVATLPSCELPAERVLAFAGNSRRKKDNGGEAPVIEQYKQFFLGIFCDQSGHGTLAIDLDMNNVAIKGLCAAMSEIEKKSSSAYSQIILVYKNKFMIQLAVEELKLRLSDK